MEDSKLYLEQYELKGCDIENKNTGCVLNYFKEVIEFKKVLVLDGDYWILFIEIILFP